MTVLLIILKQVSDVIASVKQKILKLEKQIQADRIQYVKVSRLVVFVFNHLVNNDWKVMHPFLYHRKYFRQTDKSQTLIYLLCQQTDPTMIFHRQKKVIWATCFFQKQKTLSIYTEELLRDWETEKFSAVKMLHIRQVPHFHLLKRYHLILHGYFWTGVSL